MTDKPTTNIVCYMLHFDEPLRGHRHYIGSTNYDRRYVRWREHALGNGSAYTKQFIKAGIGFHVVRLWFSHTREQERSLKNNGDMRRYCPMCSATLPKPDPCHYEPMAWAPTQDLGFWYRKRPNR